MGESTGMTRHVKPWVAIVATAAAFVIFGGVWFVVSNRRVDREFGASRKSARTDDTYLRANKLAMQLNLAGNSYATTGMYDSALTCYREALRIAEKAGITRRMAASYANISNVFQSKYMPESARFYTDAAIALNRVSHTPNRTIGGLVDQGTFMYSTVGNLDSGRVLLEKGLAECLERHDRGGAEIALYNLGSLYATQRDYDSAQVLYESCAAVSRSISDQSVEAGALHSLAQIYLCHDRLDDAKSWLLKTIEVAHSGGIVDAEAGALYDLSVIRADQGDCELAQVNVEAALKLYELMADNDGVGRCRSLREALTQDQRRENRSRTVDSLIQKQKQESLKSLGS